MSKKTKGIILILLGISIALLALSLLNSNAKQKETNISKNIPEKQNVFPQGRASAENIELKYESKNNIETNVYDFMSQMQKEGKITFKDKTYTGMGKFIEEINGIKNGEKNWIYYVNNVKANIGVSNYKINNGDIVSWKYE